MPSAEISRTIDESIALSVQDVQLDQKRAYPVIWWALAGDLIVPWWSPTRDVQLRNFWKKSDHLSGALYTMVSKMQAIPTKIEARNKSNRKQVEEASAETDLMRGGFQFGRGWGNFYGKCVEDLLTQDNGFFAQVIGFGDKAHPIVGRPVSLAHLDSSRCTRTGNVSYPVIYTDLDGTMYKLHDSRVMYASQQESPIAEMFGVGVCAISRCVNVSQTLIDILTYKMERLGSRPPRKVIITKGGLDPADFTSAFSKAEAVMDSIGLKRYAKTVVIGSQTLPDADAEALDLFGLPEGFDEQNTIMLGMAAIALAFGTDARELFPAMTAGATRADALLQHLKQRGKGPGQILQTTEDLMNYKYLPPYMKFVSDFQDDAQDRQSAEIGLVRSNRRVQDFSTGAEDERTMREQMETQGDIDRAQFEQMELRSGRLPDGSPVASLFFKSDPRYTKYLKISGVDNVLDVNSNDPLKVMEYISGNRAKVYETLANSGSEIEKWIATQCDAALSELEVMYAPPMGDIDPQSGQVLPPGRKQGDNRPSQGNNGKKSEYIDPRLRRQDQTAPSPGSAMENSFGDAGEL